MKVIAHRGASGEFPENSLLAFEQAIKQKADGIELDVQFHEPSQQFILLHDAYLDAISDLTGHFNQYSLEQLTQLPLGDDQYLITLSTALAFINGRTLVNIELKTTQYKAEKIELEIEKLKVEIDNAVKQMNFTRHQFIISSFNHQVLFHSKNIIPQIKTAALIAHYPNDNFAFAQSLTCEAINPAIECINKALVDKAHKKNYQVWAYTVDREAEIAQCLSWQVDAIFTNFPFKARNIINKLKSDVKQSENQPT